MARNLLGTWVKDGWLIVANPSRRARFCRLSAKYRQYIRLERKTSGEDGDHCEDIAIEQPDRRAYQSP